MGTAIKHPVPDRVKPPSFVIFDIRALLHSALQSVRVSGCQKLQMTGLTPSGTGCFIALYPYDNSGRQRVKR